ncbi:MAG TPA: hypothetical protein ENN07_00380 [candidate division Zixibacteria bacterium]|nr:hypothetical protein [candidate division Zixibacteria bacterium]
MNITKVGFALTFLGVFFALYPIVQEIGDAGFYYFNTFLSIRLFYFITLATLGTGIYFYGVDFIGSNSFNFARKFGDAFYAIGFAIPDIYFILWLSSRAIALLKFLETRSPTLYIIFYVVGACIDLAIFYLIIRFVYRKLGKKDIAG